MEQLNREGVYTVPEGLLAAIQDQFWAGCCDDSRAEALMGQIWRDHGYLCDPHTAAGWAAALDYTAQTGDTRPMVVLSTASPYKFPAAVLSALGLDATGDGFDQMDRLQAATGIPIDDSRAEALMGQIWRDHGYLCDPHTAAGWAAALDYTAQTGDTRPMVVLSTASPYKFPAAVLSALGLDATGDGFDQMDRLQAATGIPIPRNLASLRGKPELHTAVIDKEQMLPYVLSLD